MKQRAFNKALAKTPGCMVHYQPNWEPALLLNAVFSIALVPALCIQSSVGSNWLTIYLVFVFSLWVLSLSISLISCSSSLRIEGGEIIFTSFGRNVDRKTVKDLTEVVEERHLLPGRLMFSDNTQRRVSGITLGKTDALFKVLKQLNPSVIIRVYEVEN